MRTTSCLAVLAASTALVLTGCSTSSSDDKYYQFKDATKVGTLIPVRDRKLAENFRAELLDGGTTTLTASAGDIRVVNFWASWCGPCQSETPQFDTVYRQVKDLGVTFLGINTKDQRSTAKAFVNGNHISYPIVFDEEGEVDQRLGNVPGQLPFTILIDKHQRVAAVYLGRLTSKDVTPPIQQLRSEP